MDCPRDQQRRTLDGRSTECTGATPPLDGADCGGSLQQGLTPALAVTWRASPTRADGCAASHARMVSLVPRAPRVPTPGTPFPQPQGTASGYRKGNGSYMNDHRVGARRPNRWESSREPMRRRMEADDRVPVAPAFAERHGTTGPAPARSGGRVQFVSDADALGASGAQGRPDLFVGRRRRD